MALEVAIWIVSILCILHTRQVASQTAALVTENCNNSTVTVGDNTTISFRLTSGTFPGLAVLNVQFYHDGVKPTPDCIVGRTVPCNTTGIPPFCGCYEDGAEKVFFYRLTQVSENHAGNWTTAVEHLNDPTQAIRSPVCALAVMQTTTSAPTTSGCTCPCPYKCTIVIALVTTLAILTAALFGWTSYLCFRPGGICRGGKREKLEQWEMGLTIFLIVATGIFIIAVGAYSLNCYSQCRDDGIKTNPCCFDAYCPEAYDASIAFVVLGILVVIFAIVLLVLSCLCCPGKDPQPPPSPGPPRPIFPKKFVLAYFIEKEKKDNVLRDKLNLGVTLSRLEMFWTSSSDEGKELCPVGIVSTGDKSIPDGNWKGPGIPDTIFKLRTLGKDLKESFTLKNFVLVYCIATEEMLCVPGSWIKLGKDNNGLESFIAALPPTNLETHAKKRTPPSDKWERIPVMILGSADDSQTIEKALEDIRKAQERNKRNDNPESQDERM